MEESVYAKQVIMIMESKHYVCNVVINVQLALIHLHVQHVIVLNFDPLQVLNVRVFKDTFKIQHFNVKNVRIIALLVVILQHV